MSFRLSQRSMDRLEGVHPAMTGVVERAIQLTKVDFGVTQGVRTLEEQKANVAAGRSQTMKSKHLLQDDGFSHAVDVVAYVGSDVSWELNLYDNICDAFKQAAEETGAAVKWGAAWSDFFFFSFFCSALVSLLLYVVFFRSQVRMSFFYSLLFVLFLFVG